MAFDKDKFLSDILDGVNLSDADKAALQNTLSNPTVAKRLEDGQLRQSDYSRQSAEAQAKINEAMAYRQTLVDWQSTELQRIEAMKKGITPTTTTTEPSKAYLTQEDYDKRDQKLQQDFLNYTSTLTNKSISHFQEFGKPLDPKAVIAKATEKGCDFETAYDIVVKSDRDAKAALDLEARIKREREEAVKEAIANATIPTGNTAQPMQGGNPHVLDQISAKDAKFGWKAAVEAHSRDIMAGTVQHE